MGHPFSKYVNLELYFERGNGDFVRNPATGNREETFTVIPVSCSVKQVDNAISNVAGVDSTAILLEGYMVNPKEFPAYVYANTRVKAKLTDLFTGNIQEGEYYIMLTAQTRFKAVSKVLGNKITGWFKAL